MKVKVILPFSDKYNLTRTYNPGEVVDFDAKRAENIVARGLGELIPEQKAYKAPEVKVEAPAESPAVEEAPAEAPVGEEAQEPKKRRKKKDEEE